MREIFIIVLTGQGDTDIKVVNQETWEWIIKDTEFPLGENSIYEIPPGMEETAFITIGSSYNDKALAVQTNVPGYEDNDDEYFDLADIFRMVSEQGDKVVDQFHGYIY